MAQQDYDTGFGIGGINRQQSTKEIAVEIEAAAREADQKQTKQHHGFGYRGTRYEEDCENCHKFSFEICNECGCCKRCCAC